VPAYGCRGRRRAPPGRYATEVRLPLRPGAEPSVRAALDSLDPTLLLALPGLARIELADRTLSREDGPDGTVLLRTGTVRSAGGSGPRPARCRPSCSPAGRSRNGNGRRGR